MVSSWKKDSAFSRPSRGRPTRNIKRECSRSKNPRTSETFPKSEFEAKARPHGFGQSIFIDGQDLEPRLSLFHRLSCSLYPIPWYRKGLPIRLKQIQSKRTASERRLSPNRAVDHKKGREEIQMGNTHPLNHVLLYWLSAAPGLNPGSIRLWSLWIFLCTSCLLTRKQSAQFRHKVDVFPQHGKTRFEVLISGSKIRNQNCSLKLLPRGEVLQPSAVRSRRFNTVRSAVKQLLRGASSSQALRRVFVEPQRCFGIDRMRAWKVHPVSRQFSDPSV